MTEMMEVVQQLEQEIRRESSLLRKSLECGPILFQATGTSMSPIILPDDEVALETFPLEDVVLGDILLYESVSGRFLLHRFHGISPCGGWLTRGDRRRQFDTPVAPERVIARVVEVSRRGWRFQNSLYLALIFRPFRGLGFLLGRSFLERLYGVVLAVTRLIPPPGSRCRIELVRADWESVLISELCGTASERVIQAVDQPHDWLCLVAFKGGAACGCVLFHTERGVWSLEALGSDSPETARELIASGCRRIYGVRSGRLECLRHGIMAAESEPLRRLLLSVGFVKTPGGLSYVWM